MKNYNMKLFIGLILLTTLSACYKDKGNYEYDMPIEPKVVQLDTLYTALVGDSLIIEPKFENIDAKNISCSWKIYVPETISPDKFIYSGKSLRTLFGLQAKKYMARMTLTNTENGMKYFYDFKIQGVTEFSKGSLVLSVENEKTELSFIKPDGSVQARIYDAINLKSLPDDPLNIHFLSNKFTGNTPLGYWIICKNDAIRLDVNNLKQDEVKPNSLANNFFIAPPTMTVGNLMKHPQGVLMGNINGKFYGGTTSTWDQAGTYGMFGSFADGDYELGPKMILADINNSVTFLGYEKNKRQFLRFNVYGSPMYFGLQYAVTSTAQFDPTNLQLDLIDMVQVNSADTYAYCKDSGGEIYELKFTYNFNGPFMFTPLHKRKFLNQELMKKQPKMLATRTGNIYLAADNKVYRYNPINESLIEIQTVFTKPVSMIKLSDDENSLIVGTEGTIYYCNIETGQNGGLIKKIEGIPGAPVDMTWR